MAGKAKTLNATVPLFGNDFHFKLSTRSLVLGDAATIQYYWISSQQLRKATDEGLANFRACVGMWWAAMHERGRQNDLNNQVHYVTALCYPLVCMSKGLQDIYRDAFAARKYTNNPGRLTALARLQIHDVVKSRDRFQVEKELNGILARFEPSTMELPLLQAAFRSWTGKGVVMMRERGDAGLVEWLREVNSWIGRFRKRSPEWVRRFVNMFAYEAKARFYFCYANAWWAALIPWLRNHRDLDEVSERFLRFWHNQTQPIEIPHGRTLSGIEYPTNVRINSIEAGVQAGDSSQSRVFRTQHIGATHVRDVFCGQVLSLHPLSSFFMQDPDACAAAGRFFTCDRYQDVMSSGDTSLCSEYWDLIGAILTAAHRYRQALDNQYESRTDRLQRCAQGISETDPSSCSEATLMEDFAISLGHRCPNGCKAPLKYESTYDVADSTGEASARYLCPNCPKEVTIKFDQATLRAFFERERAE